MQRGNEQVDSTKLYTAIQTNGLYCLRTCGRPNVVYVHGPSSFLKVGNRGFTHYFLPLFSFFTTVVPSGSVIPVHSALSSPQRLARSLKLSSVNLPSKYVQIIYCYYGRHTETLFQWHNGYALPLCSHLLSTDTLNQCMVLSPVLKCFYCDCDCGYDTIRYNSRLVYAKIQDKKSSSSVLQSQ